VAEWPERASTILPAGAVVGGAVGGGVGVGATVAVELPAPQPNDTSVNVKISPAIVIRVIRILSLPFAIVWQHLDTLLYSCAYSGSTS
jgi:hypothetical protein